jgi:hypothetical protein
LVVTPPSGRYNYCGGAVLTSDDELVVVYSQSASTQAPGLYAAVKQPWQSSFTDAPLTLWQGTQAYDGAPFHSGNCDRWGDYPATALDTQGIPWLFGEVGPNGEATQYQTLVASILAPTAVGNPVSGRLESTGALVGAQFRIALPPAANERMIRIVDVNSRLVRTLHTRGAYADWDGRTAAGARVGSGLYFAVMPSIPAKRLVLLR